MSNILKSILLSFLLLLPFTSFTQIEEETDVSLDEEVALDVPPNIKSSSVGDRKSGIFYGFKNNGKIIIPFEYKELPGNLTPLMRAKKGQKFGVINSKNEILVPFIYDELPYTISELMVAKKGERKGLVNGKGKEIIPIEYAEIYSIPFRQGRYIAVKANGELKEFEASGLEKAPDYIYFKNFAYKKFISIGKKDGTYGLVDYENQDIIPFIYDCPLAFIRSIEGGTQWKTCKNGQHGVMDSKGQVILAFDYQHVEETIFTKWYQIKEGEKIGVVNTAGKIIVPIAYEEIGFGSFNRARIKMAIVKNGTKKGVYNAEGKMIVPLEYDFIKPIENKYLKVGKGDLFGLFDAYGNLVLPCEFDKTIRYRKGTLSAYREGERMGKYSSDGQLIVAKTFPVQKDIGAYLLVAESDKSDAKKGVMDKVGNLLIEPIYDSFSFQKNEAMGLYFGIVEQEGKFAFFIDNRFPKITAFTQFKYYHLAFGIYKKDAKKLLKQGQKLKDIIGYSIASDSKKRTYVTVKRKEIVVE